MSCAGRTHNKYCANYFPGRVMLSPLDVVLARMGSSALIDKLTELQQVTRSNLDQNFKKGALANLTKQSETSSKPDERTIDDRYWLARLADVCLVPSESTSCTPLIRLNLHRPLPLTARWHLRWTAFRRRLGRRPRKTAWLQQDEEVRRRPPPFRSSPVKHPQHPSTSSYENRGTDCRL